MRRQGVSVVVAAALLAAGCVGDGPGPGEATLEMRDAAGRTREVTLSGEPTRLDRSLLPARRHVTLTVMAGDVSVDAFEVR